MKECVILPDGQFSSRDYESLIAQFLEQELLTKPASKETLLESLTNFFIGSKETRNGRVPPPEVLVVVREYIASCIDKGEPINVLVPWGGKKPFASSVDVAELSALKLLDRLMSTVKIVYPPGLNVVMRIEDVNAEWLYKEGFGVEHGNSQLQSDIIQYSGDIGHLATFFHITPKSEFMMMNRTDYIRLASELTPLFISYIEESDRDGISDSMLSYKRLADNGWRGVIPSPQRDYYRERYKSLYGVDDRTATIYLAKYFAGSLARHQMNGTGFPRGEKHIQLSFAPPVPGVPATMFRNTFFLRTIPESHGRTHIPPWRAKGYVCIRGDQPVFKLASPNDVPPNLTPASVIVRGTVDVKVRADYQLL